MHKLLLALTLLLTPVVAEACPVKKGYVGNGLLATPVGLTPECGAFYTAYRRPTISDRNIKWAELYQLRTAAAKTVGGAIERRLKSKGFALLKSQQIESGHQLGYANLDSQKIVMVQIMIIQGSMYLGILGN